MPVRAIVMATLACVALAGCSKSTPDQPSEPPEATEPAPVPVPTSTPTVVTDAPRPMASPTPKPVADPAEEKADADTQVLDDADATGMTAHLPREDDTINASETPN